jgi:hypothetical protein
MMVVLLFDRKDPGAVGPGVVQRPEQPVAQIGDTRTPAGHRHQDVRLTAARIGLRAMAVDAD